MPFSKACSGSTPAKPGDRCSLPWASRCFPSRWTRTQHSGCPDCGPTGLTPAVGRPQPSNPASCRTC
eukprot:7360802-Pyramimonas_sp.AAC.1